MKRRWVLWFVAFAALTAAAVASQEREVTLRFRFVPKQQLSYEQRFEGEMAMTLQVAGQEVPINMTMKGQATQTQRVDEVDKEGVASLTVTTKGRMNVDIAGGLPVTPETPREQEIPPMRVRLKMNPLGKIVEVKLEEAETPAHSPSPVPIPSVQAQNVPTPLSFPEKPVRTGDSWDIGGTMEMTIGDRTVKLEMKGQARLVAFEKLDGRDCAVIETTTELPDLSDLLSQMVKAVPGKGASVYSSSEGRATGKVWFDVANGIVVRREETTEMTMTYTISSPTGESFSMSMQGSFRTEERLTKMTQAEEGK